MKSIVETVTLSHDNYWIKVNRTASGYTAMIFSKNWVPLSYNTYPTMSVEESVALAEKAIDQGWL